MNKKRSARRRAGGYSLLELMVTLAVAGTLAAIALPALGSLIRDTRRATVVNELVATLVLARSEAVKRGQNVVVCGFHDADGDGQLDEAERACSGHDWSDGWIAAAWIDADGDGMAEPAELAAPPIAQVVNTAPGVTVRAPTFMAGAQPAGSAVIRPMSRRSSNGTLTVCDGRTAEHGRVVIVSPSGRARSGPRRPDGALPACPAP